MKVGHKASCAGVELRTFSTGFMDAAPGVALQGCGAFSSVASAAAAAFFFFFRDFFEETSESELADTGSDPEEMRESIDTDASMPPGSDLRLPLGSSAAGPVVLDASGCSAAHGPWSGATAAASSAAAAQDAAVRTAVGVGGLAGRSGRSLQSSFALIRRTGD